ncbi:hypothetical protein ACVIW0_000084 [Bradyrhizobium sp. USDA 4454]
MTATAAAITARRVRTGSISRARVPAFTSPRAPRLDAGTEVLPGDRKFNDYAYPPDVGYPSFARENNNRPIDRQPLSPPADLGGYPRTFPLY